MVKQIKIERDGENNISILLDDKKILGEERDGLHLSTGEQNFISLAFEFLRAKNIFNKIIVLDDPISSFDSIYKCRVVYAIVRMLREKQIIILTHNTDLIRLLKSQHNNCFELYLLNNTPDENNGFIEVSPGERDMITDLVKLINVFRGGIILSVIDKKLFLISMVPFMRGYAELINNDKLKEELTQLMHGYKEETVCVGDIYNELFNFKDENLFSGLKISASDITDIKIDGIDILNVDKYFLLNRALKHTLTYLHLRLHVEKTLMRVYGIKIRKNLQLGAIISEAFPETSKSKIVKERRINLMSKKTLINEFNHFEGNLSIFQPAIDITDSALVMEKNCIMQLMEEIHNEFVQK